ncbi:hypothetical protein YIM73052_24140 [Thermus antranikianii]
MRTVPPYLLTVLLANEEETREKGDGTYSPSACGGGPSGATSKVGYPKDKVAYWMGMRSLLMPGWE